MPSSFDQGLDMVQTPRYSLSETDRLAGVSPGTSRRWLSGYRYRSKSGELVSVPPITSRPVDTVQPAASFLDLVEVVAIGGLHSIGFSLHAIRRIVVNCQELLDTRRPLVSETFKTDGREIFVEHEEALLEVGKRKGMRAWHEVLEPFLETLDYRHELATRWWPLGRENLIVVDPEFGFGFPVVASSGVRTEIVLEQFRAGELPGRIAESFGMARLDVDRALQFEARRLAA